MDKGIDVSLGIDNVAPDLVTVEGDAPRFGVGKAEGDQIGGKLSSLRGGRLGADAVFIGEQIIHRPSPFERVLRTDVARTVNMPLGEYPA